MTTPLCTIPELIEPVVLTTEGCLTSPVTTPVSSPPTLTTPHVEYLDICPCCKFHTFDCTCDSSDDEEIVAELSGYHSRKAEMNNLIIENYRVPRDQVRSAFSKKRSPLHGQDRLLQVDYDEDSAVQRMLKFANPYLEKMQKPTVDPTNDEIAKYLEDLGILTIHLRMSSNIPEILLAFTNFIKLRSGKSITYQLVNIYEWCSDLFPSDWWEDLFEFNDAGPVPQTPLNTPNARAIVQVDAEKPDKLQEWLDLSGGLLESFDSVKKLPLFRKFHKFLLHSFAHSLFIGGDIEKFGSLFFDIESEAFTKVTTSKGHFLHACCDLLHFLVDRGYQCVKMGKITPMIHGSSSYDVWFNKVVDLEAKAPFVSNPEPHGFTLSSFLADMAKMIEKGESMYALARVNNKIDAKFIGAKLARLKYIKAATLSKSVAMQDRKAPLAFLIAGATSVGKSLFSKLLFTHYGKLHGLEFTTQFRYVRNSTDQYWVNFNSQQWCVHLDDIAAFSPAFGSSHGDPTLLEMLQVINNVPFVPIQADIEDKGKTPLLAELVLATTNQKELNLNSYFSCPQAVARRFPWVIVLSPKPKYTSTDGMLDTALIPRVIDEDSYPDYWIINVEKVVLGDPTGTKAGANNVTYVPFKEFDSIYLFLVWYREVTTSYRSQQDDLRTTEKRIEGANLCKTCMIPLKHCVCKTKCDKCDFLLENCLCEALAECNADLDFAEAIAREAMVQVEPIIKVDLPVVEIKIREDVYGQQVRSLMKMTNEIETVPRGWLWLFFARMTFFIFVRFSTLGYLMLFFLPLELLWTLWTTNLPRKIVKREVIRRIGRGADNFFKRNEKFIKIGTFVTGGLALAILVRFCSKKFSKSAKRPDWKTISDITPPGDVVTPIIDRLVQAGNEKRITPTEVEPENPWYIPDYKTTSFDISRTTSSWKGLEESKVLSEIGRSTAHITTYAKISGGRVAAAKGVALCVKGNIYVTNNHVFHPNAHECILKFEDNPHQPTSNVTFVPDHSTLIRIPDKDLVFFQVFHVPPKKDLTELIAKKSLGGNFKCSILNKDSSGNLKLIYSPISNRVRETEYVVKVPELEIPEAKLDTTLWKCNINPHTTISGDCGSPYVGFTPSGPVILGIHLLAHPFLNGVVWANALDYDIVQETCAKFITVAAQNPELFVPGTELKLGPLHANSPLRWCQGGNAIVYGSFGGHRQDMKSNVGNTPLTHILSSKGWKLEHGSPVMKGWEPKRKMLIPMLSVHNTMNFQRLREVADCFIADIKAELTAEDYELLHPTDTFTAVNGAAGVAYVDPIKRSTSAGFPFNKSKKHFFTFLPPQDGLQNPIEFDPVIIDRVAQIEARYATGERWNPVFSMCLKDEAVSFKKIKEKKTRGFSMSPVDFTIAVRKKFLSIARLMIRKRFVFEHAVGTNTCSKQWGALHDFLFGDENFKDRGICGDFGAFDKSMIAYVTWLAFHVLIEICKASGNFNEEEIKIMYGMATDCSYPLINFFGDLLMLFGVNPSGHALTVFINGIANGLYMRYVFAENSPDGTARDFKKYVRNINYGDDNAMSVHKECNFFNHTIIQDTLAAVGIVYTMADKESASVPFIPSSEMSLLKRKWVWSEDLENWAAPLEEKSIRKPLMQHVRSKTDSAEAQTMSSVASVVREYFMHGKARFLEMKAVLLEAVKEAELEAYIVPSTFPSWDSLLRDFKRDELTTQSSVTEDPCGSSIQLPKLL